ncbi:type IV pilin protein [Aurantivibrio plasticivorans]
MLNCRNRATNKGFTLIEMMIVVAIIAILASIGFPAYTNHIKKTRRADAQVSLQGLAQAMERHYTTNGTYAGAAGTTSTPADTGAPRIFSATSPANGNTVFYNLTIDSAGATSYEILATPTGDQAGDGVLGLRSTGLRGWDRDGDNDPFGSGETCWDSNC